MAYLLIDIGGTNIRVGISHNGQSIDSHKHFLTPPTFTEGLETIITTANELKNDTSITNIAVAVPGPLNKEKTMVATAPNMPTWNNQPLKQTLFEHLQAPVHIENDAALAGLGEATFGAGKNHPIVAYLTVSTGIGGSRIVNGHIDANSFGFEPGHQIIVLDGQECTCGSKGHLEGYASGAGLKKRFGKNAEDISDPAIWDEAAKYLAAGLNNIIAHWSPDIIILGGSVMKTLSLAAVETHLKNLRPVFPTLPTIAVASLGDEVGLWGALAFAQK